MKRVFIQTIETLIVSSKAHHPDCAIVGIPHVYNCCWRRLLARIDDVNATEMFLAYSTKDTACKIHCGSKSVLTTVSNGTYNPVRTHVYPSVRIHRDAHVMHMK